MGARIQSGVDGRPRNVTPRRAALTFAGNIATRSRIRPQAAHGRVAANKRPAAPASSRTPVAKTMMSGRGMDAGTMAIKSLRIGPKCERAVNANMVASAYLVQFCQPLNCDTPKTPRSRQKTREPNRTIRTAKSGLRDRKEARFFAYCSMPVTIFGGSSHRRMPRGRGPNCSMSTRTRAPFLKSTINAGESSR